MDRARRLEAEVAVELHEPAGDGARDVGGLLGALARHGDDDELGALAAAARLDADRLAHRLDGRRGAAVDHAEHPRVREARRRARELGEVLLGEREALEAPIRSCTLGTSGFTSSGRRAGSTVTVAVAR